MKTLRLIFLIVVIGFSICPMDFDMESTDGSTDVSFNP
jgi:hypothetical protein